MITNTKTFYLGIILLVIPVLGLPTSWKFGLFILCALILIYLSLEIRTIHLDQHDVPHKEEIFTPRAHRRPRKKPEPVLEKTEQDDVTFSSLE